MILKIGVFAVGALVIVWASRRNLLDVRQHGFYRFLAWLLILTLFLVNVDYWFVDPFSPLQLVAWTLLTLSLALIVIAVRTFHKIGEVDAGREDPGLMGIEKTTQLVTTGIYRYLRHPFYASLLYLTWGIFFKHLDWVGLLLTSLTTIFLYITARIEEQENIAFFGEGYQEYMHTTKMFIPFVV